VSDTSKGSNTLESFFSKVAFESNLRKKLARIEHVVIVKVYFERRKIAKVFMTHIQDFFRKSLSKEDFLVCHYLKSVSFLALAMEPSRPSAWKPQDATGRSKTLQTVAKHRQTLQTRIKMLTQWLCPRKFLDTKLCHSAMSPNIHTYSFVSFTFRPHKT